MPTLNMLACGHDQAPFGSAFCAHVRASTERFVNYVKWYVGTRLEVELVCKACAAQRTEGAPTPTEMVCRACYEHLVGEVGQLAGVGGKPEIRAAGRTFDVELRETRIPPELGGLVDIAPVPERPFEWLLLAEDGAIATLDLRGGVWARLMTATLRGEPEREEWNQQSLAHRLHVAPDGAFAAVVNDHGRYVRFSISGARWSRRSSTAATTFPRPFHAPSRSPVFVDAP
jgi:hypothetical protein